LCGTSVPGLASVCPGCGVDLAGYWRIYCMPYVLFNRAIELAGRNRLFGAVAAAGAAVECAPERAEFGLLLGKLLGQLGAVDEAIEAVARVPPSEETAALLDALLAKKYGERAVSPPDGAGDGVITDGHA
jgi:hypothetical protein